MTANFANQTMWTGDNLPVMRGMNDACVDLIYLDPPFNSNADYAAPIGSKAAGAAFKDTWSLSDVDAEWINLIEAKHPALYRVLLAAMTKSDKSYLVYMAARLLEMRRILKPTGGIYLHCDPTMSHHLKLVMDAVFGRGNFRNEIVWGYKSRPQPRNYFGRKHDAILFYAKSPDHRFNRRAVARELSQSTIGKYRLKDRAGRRYRLQGRGITDSPIKSAKDVDPKWEATHPELVVRDYLDEKEGTSREDWWTDVEILNQNSKERLGYPTQKPLALLDRIVRASSNEGDVVLDPFCGCATACVVAEKNQRQWAGIDISPKAAELVARRMENELGLFYKGAHGTDIPKRTDLGRLPPYRSHAKALYGEQGGNCAGCDTHFEPQHLEVDHIVSRAKGGTDHIENLQLLCGACNKIKGDRGMDYLNAKLQMR